MVSLDNSVPEDYLRLSARSPSQMVDTQKPGEGSGISMRSLATSDTTPFARGGQP